MKSPARFPGRAEHSSQGCSFLLESRCKRYSPEVVISSFEGRKARPCSPGWRHVGIDNSINAVHRKIIAVGMIASLLGVAVTLKAVIETSEQLTDQAYGLL